jgi:hypothetical protein
MELVIALDNSMTHRARAPDGLDASRLNFGDGGASVKKTRDGWYTKRNADGSEEYVIQSMQTPTGIQKGCKTILQERGLFHNGHGHDLRLECVHCKNKVPHCDREYLQGL